MERRADDSGRRGDARAAVLAAGARAAAAGTGIDPVTGEALGRIHDEYRALLPEPPVARHPGTGEVVTWPIDTAGLDGWFWDHHNPVRRPPRAVPEDWLILTGAVAVSSPVPHAEFVCRPGPPRPYVVPRLLRCPGVTAVVCPLRIGGDPAWAICYFGTVPPEVPLANQWGAPYYPVYRAGGYAGRAQARFWSPDNDYRVEEWIARGSVRWIAPDDPLMRLRDDPAGYPWGDLTGSTESAVVSDGRLAYPPAPPPEAAGLHVG
ncbi:hypothetical protein LX16_0252 [Stackebrandtia albiflava]|uniref:Uncharacterized protein n=1 Tax=Stackebrandtia albiflava TaxID=406432 RepID=A0A562V9S3_9ACTN|nr:hypothetical protein [Stackebrandtia albiflava]TWJ14567.1 hypothetical protein LX16_0252 [Stackebrandtia albiflava]